MKRTILDNKPRWKIELHIHTCSSRDSLLTKIPLLFMCRLKKIDCIAITDHDVLENATAYAPFFARHRVKIIAGEEIMTTEGEVIGLFLRESIAPHLSPEETVCAIIEQGGLVYIPHPYDITRAKTVLSIDAIKSISRRIHLMECHNGRNRDISFSNIQNNICEQFGIQKVVGSDAHTFFEIGRNCVWIKPFYSSTEFLDNLSSAECAKAEGIRFAHIITKLVKALKIIERENFHGLFRAIRKRCRK